LNRDALAAVTIFTEKCITKKRTICVDIFWIAVLWVWRGIRDKNTMMSLIYSIISWCNNIMSLCRVIVSLLLLINRTRGLHYREISDRGLFCTDRARIARFVQKERGPIFLCTNRESEVNKKIIIWHLYLKQTNPGKKTHICINKKCMQIWNAY
jgi:hypothetical protein